MNVIRGDANMTDLFKLFIDDAFNNKLGYYEKYFDFINNSGGIKCDDTSFCIYDVDDAIQNFRNLVKPRNTYLRDEEIEFVLICYYLYSNGYTIVEFPNFLNRPTDLSTFSNEYIRNKAEQVYGTNGIGNVTWQSRRDLIDSLIFKKDNDNLVKAHLDLTEIFKTISPRNTNFENMTNDEKLQTICNAIENMLKINGNYLNLDYSSFSLGYVTDESVKEFRHKIQCFRHGNEESIKERQAFTDIEKEFCIDYGLTICNLIYKILSTNQN